MLINAVVSAVIALAAGWAAEIVAPAIESFVAPVTSVLPAAAGERAAEVAAYAGMETLIKRPVWAGAQVVENAATGEPLDHGVFKAAVVETLTPPDEHDAKPPSRTVGITGSLDAIGR
jgi:hypothetical protein